MAKDLWVPIFVHTLFTVREAQRMSLAQAAAETRESDLLRDERRCYHQLAVCSGLCLAGGHKGGQVWPFSGGSSGYMGCCLPF